MNTWPSKVTCTILLCAVIIAYPFFAIKYFEIWSVYVILWNYFFFPVTVLTIATVIFFYIKKLRVKMPQLRSRSKQLGNDIASIFLGSIFCVMLTNAIVFSTIITTNVYFGTSEAVMFNEPVIDYSTNVTRNGRREHHIKFKDPETNKVISLGVRRKYNVGEIFSKKMYRGYWGILYSKY